MIFCEDLRFQGVFGKEVGERERERYIYIYIERERWRERERERGREGGRERDIKNIDRYRYRLFKGGAQKVVTLRRPWEAFAGQNTCAS